MKTIAFLINEIDKLKDLIRFAALLGKDIKAKVKILHVQYPQVHGTQDYMGAAVAPDPEQLQKIADEINAKVDAIIKELKAKVSGLHSIEFKSEIGVASAILKDKVENDEYDMVMLQGHAEQSFWLEDSVIMDVVHNVPCPVWIIPPDAKYQPLNKIIYATDYNEEDIKTLKGLIALAKPFDPEIMALHISNDDEFEKKLKSEGFATMLSEKAAYNKVSVKMIADQDGKDAVESLVKEAEKVKANLIVVLKDNRNFFERIFKSSFTADLIRKVQLPILVFHKA
ncbi:MAG: universal stress protein [Bacteroidales bacterium]